VKRAAPQRALPPARAPKPATNPAVRADVPTQTEPTAPTEPAIATVDRDVSAPSDAASLPDEARSRLQALVLAELQRYFADSYPMLARRRGWEGTVSLAFTIQPDGTPGDV